MSDLADIRTPTQIQRDLRGSNFASGDWLRLSALAAERPSSLGAHPTAAPMSSANGESLVDTHPHIDGYEILGVISLTATGVVYKAHEGTAERIVALKL